MSSSRKKEDILQKNGYRYNFNRMIYFNVKEKKIFSAQWVEDNDEDNLKKKIEEKGKGEEWQFYFSSVKPSNFLKEEIIKDLKA